MDAGKDQETNPTDKIREDPDNQLKKLRKMCVLLPRVDTDIDEVNETGEPGGAELRCAADGVTEASDKHVESWEDREVLEEGDGGGESDDVLVLNSEEIFDCSSPKECRSVIVVSGEEEEDEEDPEELRADKGESEVSFGSEEGSKKNQSGGRMKQKVSGGSRASRTPYQKPPRMSARQLAIQNGRNPNRDEPEVSQLNVDENGNVTGSCRTSTCDSGADKHTGSHEKVDDQLEIIEPGDPEGVEDGVEGLETCLVPYLTPQKESAKGEAVLHKVSMAVCERERELDDGPITQRNGWRIEHLNIEAANQSVNATIRENQCEEVEEPVPAEFSLDDFLPQAERENRSMTSGGTRRTKAKREGDRPLRFVLIVRNKHNPCEKWNVASREVFSDVVNEVISDLSINDPNASKAFAWADARRGYIALKPSCRKRIEVFHQAIADWRRDEDDEISAEQECQTYLVDKIVDRYSLTILLRRNLRKTKLENLGRLVFERNKKLKGSLRPVKCRYYAPDDVNLNGTSRRHWRLVHMEGNDEFLHSLAQFPDDEIFQLGSEGIQIRGGTRAELKRQRNRTAGDSSGNKTSGMSGAAISRVLGLASEDVLADAEEKEKQEYAGASSWRRNEAKRSE